MRLVTFNIWNHDTDFDKRIELLVQCIKRAQHRHTGTSRS